VNEKKEKDKKKKEKKDNKGNRNSARAERKRKHSPARSTGRSVTPVPEFRLIVIKPKKQNSCSTLVLDSAFTSVLFTILLKSSQLFTMSVTIVG
jgi:hypothetical protein